MQRPPKPFASDRELFRTPGDMTAWRPSGLTHGWPPVSSPIANG